MPLMVGFRGKWQVASGKCGALGLAQGGSQVELILWALWAQSRPVRRPGGGRSYTR